MMRVALLLMQVTAATAAGWVYAKQGKASANAADQKATWTSGACPTGKEQSPIDVVTKSAYVASLPVVETHFDAKASYVKNTGHGFQLFETSPNSHKFNSSASGSYSVDSLGSGKTTKGYSMIGGSKFNFYQVHWHSPSENTIDGKSYPLEAHFVHQLDDVSLHGTYHRLAVIGLLYEMGNDTECNVFLDKFWKDFPASKGIANYTGASFDLNTKLTEELSKGYYHWYGSLTTPPCTEGVSWNLLRVTEKVCKRQVDALKTALGKTQNGINFNNRVVQPLNHRVVSEMKPGAKSSAPQNQLPFTSQSSKWYYANDGSTSANAAVQSKTWEGLCKTGHEQSPINVVTKAAASAGKPGITTAFKTTVSYVKNTGHGFQLFETSPNSHKHNSSASGVISVDTVGASAKGYSTIGGAKYNFYQVHWHTPSENTVDGKSFAMEAHFVHQLDDPSLHGTYHRLAVIGLLYELGTDKECNPFLEKFWPSFPSAKGAAQYNGTNIDFNKKINAELARGYYHWYGSLTTPPCTEGVSWNLIRITQKVCKKQIDALRSALGKTQKNTNINNRVTQPLNHRIVTYMGPAVNKSTETSHAMKGTSHSILLVFIFVVFTTGIRG